MAKARRGDAGEAQLELPGYVPAPRPREPMAPADRDRAIARDLTAWFDRVARDLPWRRLRDPYAVWLSEIMLQQTRVDTVVPYFERFLARFPTVRHLAEAPLDDVLALWSGLGYYRRARVLHATAREVTERHGGALPDQADELEKLPGIGRYTAGAIASIAYGRRAALVDGNVARVLSRLEGIGDPIRSTAAVRALWSAADRLVPADRPGKFNEALMELGATVCTPEGPRCDACPLEPVCVARATGTVAKLPVVEKKRAVPVVHAVALVISDPAGRALFARRAEGGLFGGLWEPPMIESVASIDDARALLGAPRAVLREVATVTHVLTHRRMIVRVVAGAITRKMKPSEGLPAPYERSAWLDPEALEVGVSTLAKKILRAARPG